MHNCTCFVGTSVSNPDPDWVRIQEGKYEPQKREKVKKFYLCYEIISLFYTR
jgi:hypothetical protein